MTKRQQIVVVNAKGGCGKTTIAVNLAAYYAESGYKTTLLDYDPQGSASFWLGKRSATLNNIQSIPAYKYSHSVTRSWFLRIEADTERVILDTPAGLELAGCQRLLDKADAILVPVLPSDIDIHAATHFIADLLLIAKQHRSRQRIAVIANRARVNLLSYQKLERFLASLGIPFIATLRDTTLYTHGAEQGLGIHELKTRRKQTDMDAWQAIIEWLDALQQEKHQANDNAAG